MGRPRNFSRDGVLDKAIPIFWNKGFADTSLQDLERATGVNKSGLYTEFQDKEDLFVASLERYVQTRGGEILVSKPLGWNNVETFLRLALGCSADQKGCFAVNSMRELAGLPRAALDVILGSQHKLKRLITKNIAAGQPKIDPATAADVVLTFFNGLCIEQNLNSSKASTERKLKSVMRVIRNS
jgi:AcrR family transcriptional regulator